MESAGDVTAPASESQSGLNGEAAPGVALRDGSITVAQLIDRYLAEYRGRDTTRHQRLDYRRGRIGGVTLDQIDDDLIFAEMQVLATRRGTYVMGLDADGIGARSLPCPRSRQQRQLRHYRQGGSNYRRRGAVAASGGSIRRR